MGGVGWWPTLHTVSPELLTMELVHLLNWESR
jgi:hypothetical protein